MTEDAVRRLVIVYLQPIVLLQLVTLVVLAVVLLQIGGLPDRVAERVPTSFCSTAGMPLTPMARYPGVTPGRVDLAIRACPVAAPGPATGW